MKPALVTGVSRGIGAAVADMLIADGWSVIGLSRTAPPQKDGLYWFRWDAGTGGLTDIADILGMTGIDVLDAVIHCAASQEPVGPIRDSDAVSWADAIYANLIGTYDVVRDTLPVLERSPDARILLMSGGGSFSPRPNYSAYAASKAGVVALMECLAGELPPNVTANCVAPGFVPTGIHAPTLAAGPGIVGPEEYRHATRAGEGAMETVVACVRHLLSPRTRGLSGRTVSAPHDDWASLTPLTVPLVMTSPAGTRTRHKISALGHASRRPDAVLPCPVGVTA